MKTRIAPWLSDEVLNQLFSKWNIDNIKEVDGNQ